MLINDRHVSMIKYKLYQSFSHQLTSIIILNMISNFLWYMFFVPFKWSNILHSTIKERLSNHNEILIPASDFKY